MFLKFTPDEFEVMKQHAIIGENILKPLRSMSKLAKLVRHHHEHYDGTGYPDGLKGDDISLASRIVGIAQEIEIAFNPPQHDQAPKEKPGIESVLEDIVSKSGKQYDADVVDACLRLFHEKGFTFGEE